jgi:hypothetical protein
MDLQPLILEQRIKHIIDSYQLLGSESEANLVLKDWQNLMATYPPHELEIAVVSCLVAGWSELPMARGKLFLQRLKYWLTHPQSPPFSIEQFRQITGLEPLPPSALFFPSGFWGVQK